MSWAELGMGMCLYSLGRQSESVPHFQAAHHAHPHDVEIMYRLAIALEETVRGHGVLFHVHTMCLMQRNVDCVCVHPVLQGEWRQARDLFLRMIQLVSHTRLLAYTLVLVLMLMLPRYPTLLVCLLRTLAGQTSIATLAPSSIAMATCGALCIIGSVRYAATPALQEGPHPTGCVLPFLTHAHRPSIPLCLSRLLSNPACVRCALS